MLERRIDESREKSDWKHFNRSYISETVQAEESILYHVLIHLLHKLLILFRFLEVRLVDPIQSLETLTVKIFHFDFQHLLIFLCLHLLLLLLPKK